MLNNIYLGLSGFLEQNKTKQKNCLIMWNGDEIEPNLKLDQTSILSRNDHN